VGLQTVSPIPNADWINESVASAAAAGSKEVTLTIADAETDVLPENYFVGGQLFINDAAGEKYWYPISYSSAVTNGGTSLVIGLEEPIQVALTTSSEATPMPSPWMATILSATITTATATGVPLVDVTADYYYWSQTGGVGGYWGHTDVAAIGTALVLGADDGALVPLVLDLNATEDADALLRTVAYAYGTAGVDDEFRPCIYVLD
jgi:hypothetical protein